MIGFRIIHPLVRTPRQVIPQIYIREFREHFH